MVASSATATSTPAPRSTPTAQAGGALSALRRLVVRHPIAAYLIMAFAFAWTVMAPLLLSTRGFDVLPIDLPVTLVNSLASWVGLVLPALLVTEATGGRAGVRDFLRRCLRWRVGVQWYLIALLGTFVAVLLAAVPLVGVAPLEALASKWDLLFMVFLPGVLVPFLLINLAEEAGWTGFLQSNLQVRHGPVLASLMVAAPFALIHLPAYFVAGWINDEKTPLAQLPGVLLIVGLSAVFAVFLRLLIMWLYNGSGRSVLIVGLFHSAFNMSTGPKMTPEFVPGLDATSLNLLPWGVAAVIAVGVAIITKGHLARAGRSQTGPVRRGARPQAHDHIRHAG